MLRRILDSRWTYAGGIILLVVAAVVSQLELRVPSRPRGDVSGLATLRERGDVNVVFILIDTLRADRLGAYGYHRDTSPVMSDLAGHGVRFARVEAQSSFTKTSMASLWTGLLPTRTGVTRYNHGLPDDATLAVERFAEAGYRTLGVWRNGWIEPAFGFGQGFDMYFKPGPSKTPDRFERGSPGTHALQGSDRDATEAAIELIRSNADERFFLYVHLMDVHQYLYDQVEADFSWGTSYSDAYDASIHWVDRNVGRLMLELEELDLFERTLVVIASDHGEGFYEHGAEGHAKTLYREVTEVPWIMALPFILEEGIVVEPLVGNVDIWPTVLDLVGLPPLPDTDGRSVVPLIEASGRREPSPDGDGTAVVSYLDRAWGQPSREPRPLISVRHWPYRLVYGDDDDGAGELYNHSTDPSEQENLAEREPERVAELRALGERASGDGTAWAPSAVDLDELKLNQLRALGYVIE